MKKIIFTLAATAIALVSCTKAEVANQESTTSKVKEITVSATIPQTKVTFEEQDGGGIKVTFAADDKILVYNKTQKVSGEFTAESVDDEGVATFKGSIAASEGDVLVAYFGAESVDEKGAVVDLSEQDASMKKAANAAPMYASDVTYSESDDVLFTFANSAAVVRTYVKVPAELAVAYVELSSDENALYNSGVIGLDGNWSFSDENKGAILATYSETLSASTASGAAYIVVPAQTLADALTISAYDTNYGTYSTVSNATTTSEKGYFVNSTETKVTFEASKSTSIKKSLTGYVGSAANIDYTNCSVWKVKGDGVTSGSSDASTEGTVAYALKQTSNNISLTLVDETTVADLAFKSLTSLASVKLLKAETIGGQAFRSCTALVSAELPESLTSIGVRAFNGCTKLAGIVIPKNVVGMSYYTFMGCSSLESVEFEEGSVAYAILPAAFANCTKLTTLTFPSGVYRVDGAAFTGCSGLTAVTFKGVIKTWGSSQVATQYTSPFGGSYTVKTDSTTGEETITETGSTITSNIALTLASGQQEQCDSAEDSAHMALSVEDKTFGVDTFASITIASE